jgi:hypothetical protein
MYSAVQLWKLQGGVRSKGGAGGAGGVCDTGAGAGRGGSGAGGAGVGAGVGVGGSVLAAAGDWGVLASSSSRLAKDLYTHCFDSVFGADASFSLQAQEKG